jgi:hypothetical protein
MNIYATLISGFVFSVFIGLLITIIQIINPRAELKSYPKKIKKEVAALTEKEKKRIKTGKIILFPIVIVLILADFYLRINYQQYLYVFLHFFIVLLIWTIFDLLVMDWLIFCTITPRYLVFRGTENNKAYKNYTFHLRGLLFGIPFSIVLAGILTFCVFVIEQTFLLCNLT